MVGSDMIAIDASGDFSGCYFFTNMKTDGTGHTILGNIFKDKVYTDRYATFQKMYNEMFETEEQCKTCDYRQACYQCPAGNSDTGSKLFRPDDMCQKIVKLYIDLQDDVNKKTFMREYQKTLNEAEQVGYEKYIASGLTMLGKLYFENINLPLKEYLTQELPDYKIVAAWFSANLTQATTIESITSGIEIVDLYKKFIATNTVLPSAGNIEDIYYLNVIGQAVINKRLTLHTQGLSVR
jgi:radical SAM protein with 4Fe4S-binding SPASM domain